MSVRVLLPLFVLLLAFERSAVALRCYNCINLKSNIPLLPNEVDSSCEDIDSSTGSESCSNFGDRCIYADLSVTVSTLFGDATATLQYRGCADDTGLSKGCHTASTRDLKGPAKKLFSKFSPEITGTACYCDSDLCDAKCDGVWINNQCVAVWVIVVIVIASITCTIVFFVALCRCCSKRSSGVVLSAPVMAQPQVTVVQPINTTYPMQAALVTTAYPMPAGVNNPAYSTKH